MGSFSNEWRQWVATCISNGLNGSDGNSLRAKGTPNLPSPFTLCNFLLRQPVSDGLMTRQAGSPIIFKRALGPYLFSFTTKKYNKGSNCILIYLGMSPMGHIGTSLQVNICSSAVTSCLYNCAQDSLWNILLIREMGNHRLPIKSIMNCLKAILHPFEALIQCHCVISIAMEQIE